MHWNLFGTPGNSRCNGSLRVHVPARCLKMRETLGMPSWPNEDKSLEEENWKWQGVKANAQKLQEIMESWKADVLSCAERLEELKADVSEKAHSLESFQDSLHATQAQQLPEDIEHEGSQFAKYGSKIEKIVNHVQKVQSEDPTAKIICFVQWEDLKRKISKALKEFQVAHATLHGGVWSRQRVLRRFQYESEGPRMLLLSLEESASGTNLTAANHVLIVHPMEAESKEEAVAFEMQAVGRVRRPGQAKKIFIWRFVTFDTVEQQITEEHQKELWERQAATIQPSQWSLPAGQENQDTASDEEMPMQQMQVKETPWTIWLRNATTSACPGALRNAPCTIRCQRQAPVADGMFQAMLLWNPWSPHSSTHLEVEPC